MWWTRIVGALALLIAVTYLIQWLMPRGKSKGVPRRQYLRWDIAPTVGFFGAVLLALSFAQAATSQAIQPWAWGAAFGLVFSASAWVWSAYRRQRAAPERFSVWRSAQRYGTLVIATVIGLYVAVRVFGAPLEVFAAAALGVFVVALAAAMFVGNKPIAEETHGK